MIVPFPGSLHIFLFTFTKSGVKSRVAAIKLSYFTVALLIISGPLGLLSHYENEPIQIY